MSGRAERGGKRADGGRHGCGGEEKTKREKEIQIQKGKGVGGVKD